MDLHIKDVLKKYIKQDQKVGDAYYTEKIRSFWSKQLSSSITTRTTEINYKKGKLRVKVSSAPLRNELFNNRKQLMDRINAFLGEDLVWFIELK